MDKYGKVIYREQSGYGCEEPRITEKNVNEDLPIGIRMYGGEEYSNEIEKNSQQNTRTK